MAWDVLSGAAKMAWDVLSMVKKTALDVLSGVANICRMFCPGCQKMAWDVMSRDVLSYIRSDLCIFVQTYRNDLLKKLIQFLECPRNHEYFGSLAN